MCPLTAQEFNCRQDSPPATEPPFSLGWQCPGDPSCGKSSASATPSGQFWKALYFLRDSGRVKPHSCSKDLCVFSYLGFSYIPGSSPKQIELTQVLILGSAFEKNTKLNGEKRRARCVYFSYLLFLFSFLRSYAFWLFQIKIYSSKKVAVI